MDDQAGILFVFSFCACTYKIIGKEMTDCTQRQTLWQLVSLQCMNMLFRSNDSEVAPKRTEREAEEAYNYQVCNGGL